MMELRVLGCSGGIGAGRRTTSFLLNGTILIDAGSGVGDLTLEEMAGIRHIFLSHSHLDHVHCIPLLLDSIFDAVDTPIEVHAQPATIEVLERHLFNGSIWPDFTRLPHPDRPVLRFVPMHPGEEVILGDLCFEMIPVNHIVPTVGYLLTSPSAAVAFSSDTTTNDTFWQRLNESPRLDLLIVESAFSSEDIELCRVARHYCPSLLAADLEKLRHQPRICLTHAKPGEEQKIFDECQELIRGRELTQLSGGEVFVL